MTHKRDIMDKLKMTEHAQHRKQQRGVTDIQLQLIHALSLWNRSAYLSKRWLP
jgi:hypothetical protein